MIAVTLVPVLLGCGGGGSGRTRWVERQGGVLDDARQRRVEAVGRRVVPPHLRGAVVVLVLDSDEVTAFSWRDGSVYLTRGLVDRCTDDELAAAIAHELGHLLGDGHLPPVAGLRGCEHGLDEEERADRVGVELLRACGLPPEAMATMLSAVMESGESGSLYRQSLDGRIRAIEDDLIRVRERTRAAAGGDAGAGQGLPD